MPASPKKLTTAAAAATTKTIWTLSLVLLLLLFSASVAAEASHHGVRSQHGLQQHTEISGRNSSSTEDSCSIIRAQIDRQKEILELAGAYHRDRVPDIFQGLSLEAADAFRKQVADVTAAHICMLTDTHRCCSGILQNNTDSQDDVTAALAEKCEKAFMAKLPGAYMERHEAACPSSQQTVLLDYGVSMISAKVNMQTCIEHVYGMSSSAMLHTPELLLKQLMFPSTRDEQFFDLVAALEAVDFAQDVWGRINGFTDAIAALAGRMDMAGVDTDVNVESPQLLLAVVGYMIAYQSALTFHGFFTKPASRERCRDIRDWYDKRLQLTEVGKACRARLDRLMSLKSAEKQHIVLWHNGTPFDVDVLTETDKPVLLHDLGDSDPPQAVDAWLWLWGAFYYCIQCQAALFACYVCWRPDMLVFWRACAQQTPSFAAYSRQAQAAASSSQVGQAADGTTGRD